MKKVPTPPTPSYFIHGKDRRPKEVVESQKEEIRAICKQNEILFKTLVEYESKRKIEQFKLGLLEKHLSGGRYLTYTDRTSYVCEQDKSNPNLPVLMSIHGVPGAIDNFLNLQINTQARVSCRWINFSIPGLDKKDERRGTYSGYLDDVALLIKDFLDDLKIKEVILVVHSAGGLYGKHFTFLHPQRVKAIISLASIGIEISRPMVFQTQIMSTFGLDLQKITKEEVESEEFRMTFLENIDAFRKYLETIPDKRLQAWLAKTNYDHYMLLKIQVFENSFDQFFLNMKNLDKTIPRFFAYSKTDPLLEEIHIQQEIHHAILSPQSLAFQMKQSNSKNEYLHLRDQENILRNFIFSYDDAGHFFQHHKGFDLSVKLMVFLQTINEIKPVVSQNQLDQMRPNL